MEIDGVLRMRWGRCNPTEHSRCHENLPPSYPLQRLGALYRTPRNHCDMDSRCFRGRRGAGGPGFGRQAASTRRYLSSLSSHLDGGTQLSGPIPPELGNLRRLTHLDISNSLVSGPIPPELGNLTNLVHLSLVQNPLSGSIPSELGNLVNLTTLAVGEGYSELEGPLPLSLMNLKKLQIRL